MTPPAIFFAVTALIGVAYLVAALTISWSSGTAGWRAAMFSAAFGMMTLGGLAPFGGDPLKLLMFVPVAAAQLFVGLCAWRRRGG